MLELDTGGDALKIVWIAALVGAFAGVTSELLIARGKTKDVGQLEIPGAREKGFWDLGSFAGIPVGILAAVIAAFLFAPGEERTVGATTVRDVDLGELILVAALAGLGSSAFLALVRERFLAMAGNARLNSTLDSAIAGLEQIKQKAHQAKDPERAKRAASGSRARVKAKIDKAKRQTPPRMMRAFERRNLTGGDVVQLTADADAEHIEIERPWDEEEVERQVDEVIDSVASETASTLGDELVSQIEAIKKTVSAARSASD